MLYTLLASTTIASVYLALQLSKAHGGDPKQDFTGLNDKIKLVGYGRIFRAICLYLILLCLVFIALSYYQQPTI